MGPLVLLGALELSLRVAGVGVDTRLFIPHRVNGQTWCTSNPHFTRPYFGSRLERHPIATAFPRDKPAGEYRAFVLGESAAMGDPIPDFALSRQLQVKLTAAMPQRKVRVINAALTAINSHVIRQIAAECAQYQPDVFVIYMGNNEVVGPYGPGTVFPGIGRHQMLIHGLTALRGTRTGQLVERLLARARPSTQQAWQGMEMFLDRRVPSDDPRLVTTRRLFAENLDAICRATRRAGADVVLCTVAVNIRDCAPLGSFPPPELSPNARTRGEQRVQDALAALTTNAPGRALSIIGSGPVHEGGWADFDYLRAGAQAALGQFDAARMSYQQALELDALRFRADTAINATIRQLARKSNDPRLHVVDVEQILAEASPQRLTGENFFYDHVHLNFDGHELIARRVASVLLTGAKDPRELPDRQACALALGWSPWQAHRALTSMYGRRLLPPFSMQVDREAVEQRWMEQLITSKSTLSTNEPAETIVQLSRQLQLQGDDPVLWKLLGEAHMTLRQYAVAAGAFAKAAALLPGDAKSQRRQGVALALAGRETDAYQVVVAAGEDRSRPADAIWSGLAASAVDEGRPDIAHRLFRRALEANPKNHEALVNLAASRATDGDDAGALPMLEAALRRRPQDDVALANRGIALYRTGRRAEAIAALARAAALNPRNADTQNTLALLYLESGKLPLAQQHMASALLERPLDLELLQNAVLIDAAAKAWESVVERYHRMVRIAPADAAIHEQYGRALFRIGRYREASAAFETATRVAPARASAQFALGQSLLRTGETARGLEVMRQACDRGPAQPDWQRALAWVLATHPDAAMRRPAEALERVRTLPATGPEAWMRVDIEAAATASGGDPQAAARLLGGLDPAAIPLPDRNAVQERLATYQRGEPYVESIPAHPD